MRISGFKWDDWNVEHIDKHSVAPKEAEEACYNQPFIRRGRDGLYLIYSQTDAGRYLFIVIRPETEDMVYVITARAMTAGERRYYQRER